MANFNIWYSYKWISCHFEFHKDRKFAIMIFLLPIDPRQSQMFQLCKQSDCRVHMCKQGRQRFVGVSSSNRLNRKCVGAMKLHIYRYPQSNVKSKGLKTKTFLQNFRFVFWLKFTYDNVRKETLRNAFLHLIGWVCRMHQLHNGRGLRHIPQWVSCKWH